jgi:tRNA 2-thiouridine synthesizing protein B
VEDLLSSSDNCYKKEKDVKRVFFLLTKPPHSERAKLCFRLMEQSKNAVLYLAGDGIYNLMSCSIDVLPQNSIYACKEDMDARGVQLEDAVISLDDFYEQMVNDMMLWSDQVYAY